MVTAQSNKTKLIKKRCRPCEKLDTLSPELLTQYKAQLHEAWQILNETTLRRTFRQKNFQESMDFTNRIARLAKQEGHHPDLHIHYTKIVVDLTTHTIKGLSENDFILATKIDEIAKE